jgi:hypothetical protein
MNRLLDRDASASPANRFNYLYTWNLLNGGSDDGTFSTDGYSAGYFNGIMTEEDFPKQTSAYQFSWASGYNKYFNAMHYRVASTISIEVADTEGIYKLKHYLYDGGEEGEPGGIVSFGSAAGNWRFDDDYLGPSETGYHCMLTKLATEGAHAMTIVGYDDTVECLTDDGQLTYGAFIAVNSWGVFYHDRGRYYLPYHFFLDRSGDGILDMDVTGVNVKYEDPTVVFKINMDYTSRDDISFKMGIADKPYSELPSNNFPVSIFNNAGGDNGMQGALGPSEIELGLNFSDYASGTDRMDEPKFFLIVSRNRRGNSAGEGSVTSVEVYDYRNDPFHPTVYSSPDADGSPLKWGDNIFGIPTTPLKYTSASPVRWLDKYGKPLRDPFVVRTSSGRYAKIRFTGYDPSTGKITFEYVLSGDEEGSFVRK